MVLQRGAVWQAFTSDGRPTNHFIGAAAVHARLVARYANGPLDRHIATGVTSYDSLRARDATLGRTVMRRATWRNGNPFSPRAKHGPADMSARRRQTEPQLSPQLPKLNGRPRHGSLPNDLGARGRRLETVDSFDGESDETMDARRNGATSQALGGEPVASPALRGEHVASPALRGESVTSHTRTREAVTSPVLEAKEAVIVRRKFSVLPQISDRTDCDDVDSLKCDDSGNSTATINSDDGAVFDDEISSKLDTIKRRADLKPILKNRNVGRRLRLSAHVTFFVDGDAEVPDRRASIANENSLLPQSRGRAPAANRPAASRPAGGDPREVPSSDVFRMAMSEFSPRHGDRTAVETSSGKGPLNDRSDTPIVDAKGSPTADNNCGERWEASAWESTTARNIDGVLCSTIHSDTPRRRHSRRTRHSIQGVEEKTVL